MRIALTAAALALLVAAPAASQAPALPDFSGTWVLQIDKSNFGPMPGVQARTDVIEHQEPNLTIKRTSTSSSGETTSNLVFVVDGKPHKNTAGPVELTSVLKWEGQVLMIASTIQNPQGGELTLTDRMSLSEDGKTLTQVRVWSAPGQGEATQTFVLLKQ